MCICTGGSRNVLDHRNVDRVKHLLDRRILPKRDLVRVVCLVPLLVGNLNAPTADLVHLARLEEMADTVDVLGGWQWVLMRGGGGRWVLLDVGG